MYSPSEFIKNAWSLINTKLFFKKARLVRRPIYIRGRRGMEYGEGFTTGYRCRIEIFAEKGEVPLKIGKNCKIGDNVHIAASDSVKIGDDCLMASFIYISDTNHGNGNDDPAVPPDLRPLSSSPVEIGDRVWIGEGVAVLPGTAIGDGCIIGAHSVVKGNIPSYTVAVGAPARVVKKYDFERKCWEKI